MKYIITYNSSINETYHASSSIANIVKHNSSDSYEVESLDVCKKIINDFMDVPLTELTLDQIKDDFAMRDCNIDEEKAVQILNYYNGRLALYNTIMKDIDCQSDWQMLKYDIPAKYATFDVESAKDIEKTEIIIQKW